MGFFAKNYRWLLPLYFGLASGLTAVLLYYFSNLSNLQIWRESNMIWLIMGGISVVEVWLIRSYPTPTGLISYALCIGVASGFIAGYTDDYLLHWFVQHDKAHLEFLGRSFADRMIIAFAITIPMALITAVFRHMQEVEERFSRHSGAEQLLRDAELFKLRQQLQPHFLYNSLNAINSLVLIDPDKAQDMVGKLSDFLRASVKKDGSELQSVDEELAYLEAYLCIEAVRFGDRLKVVYHKAFTDDARMPAFLLQPLIENAIKFGLYGQTGDVTITVHIQLQDHMLTIEITNPYDPLMQPQKGTGFGLEGIRRRLYLLYGRDDLVQTKGEDQLFITTLKIPQVHVQSTVDR